MENETELRCLNNCKISNSFENDKSEKQYIFQYKKIPHLKYRIVKTFVLFLSWIALGLFSEIIGPGLPAIRVLNDVNYEEISRSLSARAVGLLVGSLIGGLLADMFINFRNFLIFIFLTIAGISVATIPLCRSLSLLIFNMFICGFSHGAFTTSGNPSLGSLWKDKSTGPYNFMHSGYGLGAAIAPLLISAFDTSNGTTYSNATLTKESSTFIQYSFAIVALYCLFIGIIFLIYCFIKNPIDTTDTQFCRQCHGNIGDASNSVKEEGNRNVCSHIRENIVKSVSKLERKMIVIMIVCFITYFALVGNERVFGKFQFSYAIEGPLKMSRSKGYLINCLYWISFCLARIFMAVVALKVPAKILLIVEICGALVSSAIFTIWSNSELIFFIFSTSFGFFKSPLFPTMLGALSVYVTVTGILVVIVNFGSAGGAAACQYLAGYLIHNYGHYTFPMTVTGTTVFLMLVIIIYMIVTRKW